MRCQIGVRDMTKTKWALSSHHKDSYAAWAGNPKGHKPDPDECAATVYHNHSRMFTQCSRKRGHGPEQAFCKQHDPVAVKKRNDEKRAKWEAEWAEKDRKRDAAKRARELEAAALELIKQIASGHNDPRGAAIDLLESHNATPEQHETATPAENGNETDS